jgi:hypothetical protein
MLSKSHTLTHTAAFRPVISTENESHKHAYALVNSDSKCSNLYEFLRSCITLHKSIIFMPIFVDRRKIDNNGAYYKLKVVTHEEL